MRCGINPDDIERPPRAVGSCPRLLPIPVAVPVTAATEHANPPSDRELESIAKRAYVLLADVNRFVEFSPRWYAWTLGRYLLDSGRTQPSDVRYLGNAQFGVRDMVFDHNDKEWSRTQ